MNTRSSATAAAAEAGTCTAPVSSLPLKKRPYHRVATRRCSRGVAAGNESKSLQNATPKHHDTSTALVLVETKQSRGKCVPRLQASYQRRHCRRGTPHGRSSVPDENQHPPRSIGTDNVHPVTTTTSKSRVRPRSTQHPTLSTLHENEISTLLMTYTHEDAETMLSDFALVLEGHDGNVEPVVESSDDVANKARPVPVELLTADASTQSKRGLVPAPETFQPINTSTRAPAQSRAALNVGSDATLQPVSMNRDGVVALALAHEVILYSGTTDHGTPSWTRRHSLVRFAAGHFTSVAWCPVQRHILAVGTSDGYITLYDTQQLVRVYRFQAHQGRVSTIAWRSGADAAHGWSTGGADGRVVHCDVRHPHSVQEFSAHRGPVHCLQWHPHHASRWASGGADQQLLLWDVAAHTSTGSTRTGRPHGPVDGMSEPDSHGGIVALTWSPCGDILAAAGGRYGSHIRMLCPHQRTKMGSLDTGSSVTALAWPSRDRLVSAHASAQVCAWHTASLSFAAEYTGPLSCVLHMGMVEPSWLYAVGSDEVVHVWDM